MNGRQFTQLVASVPPAAPACVPTWVTGRTQERVLRTSAGAPHAFRLPFD